MRTSRNEKEKKLTADTSGWCQETVIKRLFYLVKKNVWFSEADVSILWTIPKVSGLTERSRNPLTIYTNNYEVLTRD